MTIESHASDVAHTQGVCPLNAATREAPTPHISVSHTLYPGKGQREPKGTSVLTAGMEGHSCYFKYSVFLPTLPPSTPASIHTLTIKLSNRAEHTLKGNILPLLSAAHERQLWDLQMSLGKGKAKASVPLSLFLSSICSEICHLLNTHSRNEKWLCT